MEQKVVLLGQEAKSDLSAAGEAVARLETQLEVELDKLTAKDKMLFESKKQNKNELNTSLEAHAQLKKDHKRLEGELRREFELQSEDENSFFGTCDERRWTIGQQSESSCREGGRGGVASGWNSACQSLST